MFNSAPKGLVYAAACVFLIACGGDESQQPSQDPENPQQEPKKSVFHGSMISTSSVSNELCPSGAIQIELGIDANSNGRLDPDEVDHSRTQTVCHGTIGTDGDDGINSLINITDAEVALCEYGGKTLSIGSDTNQNGQLDLSEVTQNETICNLAAPTFTSLINTQSEPAGPNCVNGGVKIETGLDSNENSVLDNSEIQNVEFICHGSDGVDGVDGTDADFSGLLIETVEEPWGDNCFHGGEKHQIGLDTDQNGILEVSEIISASYSCNLNEAPLIEYRELAQAIAGQSYTFLVSTYDVVGDASEVSITAKPDWLSINQTQLDRIELSGVAPADVDATYIIEISATDTDAVSTQTYEFTAVDGILISTSSDTITEGNSGSQEAVFTVALSKASVHTVSVSYGLNSFTSELGVDWIAENTQGTLQFSPGEISKQVSITVQADLNAEITETVRLDIHSIISEGEVLLVNAGAGYIDIINDDGNELTFGTEQENRVELIKALGNMYYCCMSVENIRLDENAPEWLRLDRDIDWQYGPGLGYPFPDFETHTYSLVGNPTGLVIGDTGNFSIIVNDDRGANEYPFSFRITEGDTDNDGVLNSDDAFPNNANGHTDSDTDGLGDEWEMSIFENLETANATSDFDNNGVTDLSAFQNNTPAHDLTFSFESGQLPNGWINTGNVDWIVTDEVSHHGSYALKPAQALEPGQVARLEFSVNTQRGDLRVSGLLAEGEGQFDSWNLQFRINENNYNSFYLAEGYWNTNHQSLSAGEQKLILEYRNNSSTHTARQVYIDNFSGLKGLVPADRDGDGIANAEDLYPDNALGATDTDGDGIGDEWEMSVYGTLDRVNASSDYDSDGLSDVDEFIAGSNPNYPDSDNDGVFDGEDLYVMDNRYARDSDSDGLPDEWELIHFASLGDTDGTGNADGDAFTDAEEFAQGSVPSPDTDGDGYSDQQDAFPDNAAYALDKDDDSLPDEWELQYCPALHYDLWLCEHNPEILLAVLSGQTDFDGDGQTDFQEFNNGTDPTVVNLTLVQDVLAVSSGQSITFNPTENDNSAVASISVSEIQLPQAGQGSLQDNADGTYTYTAPVNYIGWVSLSYTASDETSTDSGQVMIRVSDQQFGQVVKIKGAENYSGGSSHAMALFDDGLLYAWGNNASGQLGLGDNETRYSPVLVVGIDNVQDFDLGGEFSLVLKADGTVWHWGYGGSNAPQQIASLANIQAIAVERSIMHVLNADLTVSYSYASNGPSASFNLIAGMSNIQSIAAGYSHLLALDHEGNVWSEGSNGNGQLGSGTNMDAHQQAVKVSKISNIESIEAGGNQSFAIDGQGRLFAWGYNDYGQLGDGTTTERNVPVEVAGINNVAKVATGSEHTLVKTTDGSLYGMGYGYNGRLGSNTNSYRNLTPVLLSGEPVSFIGTGPSSSYVVTATADTLSVGQNNDGQLGDGTTTKRRDFINIDWLHVGYEGLLSEADGEGFEWGLLPSFWRNTGDNWEISTEANTGDYSFKVKDSLGDYSSASFGLQVTTGDGVVSFAVKTSTEEAYDELVFYIDGVEQARYSGEVDWAITSDFVVTAGAHVMEWTYIKDGGTSVGEDAVWIDDIKLPLDTDGDGELDVSDIEPNNPAIQ